MRIEFFSDSVSPKESYITSSTPIEESFIEALEKILDLTTPIGDMLREVIFREILKNPSAKKAYGFRFCTYVFKVRKFDNKVTIGRPVKTSPTYFIGGKVLTSNQAKKGFPNEFSKYRKFANYRPYKKPVILCQTGSIRSFNADDVVLDI